MLSVGNCSWKKSLPATARASSYNSPCTSKSREKFSDLGLCSQRPALRLEVSASNVGICEEDGRAGMQTQNRRSQMQSLADRLRPGGFLADGLSYKENFTIRCYEVGVNRTATIEAIANLLQVCGFIFFL